MRRYLTLAYLVNVELVRRRSFAASGFARESGVGFQRRLLLLVEKFEEAPYDMVGNWKTSFFKLFADPAIAHAFLSGFEQRVFVRQQCVPFGALSAAARCGTASDGQQMCECGAMRAVFLLTQFCQTSKICLFRVRTAARERIIPFSIAASVMTRTPECIGDHTTTCCT
jgi:hypothetical protein